MKGKIFNAQEVQAIIAGNKTQFREVIKEIGNIKLNSGGAGLYFGKCPYQVGQKIFVKESFWEAGGKIIYKADYESYKPISPWRRAMKQEHSRLFPIIKSIGVERLADISVEDAIKEGIEFYYEDGAFHSGLVDEIDAFKDFWNVTHKKPEEKFEANPWVWCVTMEAVK